MGPSWPSRAVGFEVLGLRFERRGVGPWRVWGRAGVSQFVGHRLAALLLFLWLGVGC